MCGVAGFAIGEIGTSLLTGGIVAGARFVGNAALRGVQAGARAGRFSQLATSTLRSIPRPPTIAVRSANAVVEATAVVMTATQRGAVRSYEALTSARSFRILRVVARNVNRSAVAKTARFLLRPIGYYIHALDSAFMVGMNSTDSAITMVSTRLTRPADAVASGLPELNAAIPSEASAIVVMNEREIAAIARTDDVVEATQDAARVTPPAGATNAAPEVLTTEEQTRRLVVDSQVEDLIAGTSNIPELIIRYSDDPEYKALFQAEKVYPEQTRDIAIIIKDMEIRSPHLSKAQVSDEVRVFLSTCGTRR